MLLILEKIILNPDNPLIFCLKIFLKYLLPTKKCHVGFVFVFKIAPEWAPDCRKRLQIFKIFWGPRRAPDPRPVGLCPTRHHIFQLFHLGPVTACNTQNMRAGIMDATARIRAAVLGNIRKF